MYASLDKNTAEQIILLLFPTVCCINMFLQMDDNLDILKIKPIIY